MPTCLDRQPAEIEIVGVSSGRLDGESSVCWLAGEPTTVQGIAERDAGIRGARASPEASEHQRALIGQCGASIPCVCPSRCQDFVPWKLKSRANGQPDVARRQFPPSTLAHHSHARPPLAFSSLSPHLVSRINAISNFAGRPAIPTALSRHPFILSYRVALSARLASCAASSSNLNPRRPHRYVARPQPPPSPSPF
jgi:hypothetical protein